MMGQSRFVSHIVVTTLRHNARQAHHEGSSTNFLPLYHAISHDWLSLQIPRFKVHSQYEMGKFAHRELPMYILYVRNRREELALALAMRIKSRRAPTRWPASGRR